MQIQLAFLVVTLFCICGCGRTTSVPSQSDFLTKASEYTAKSRDAARFLDLEGTLPEVGDRVAHLTTLFTHLPPVPADMKDKAKIEEAILSLYNDFTFAVRLLVMKSRNGDKPNREELEKEQAEFKTRVVEAIIKNCNFLDATLGFDNPSK